MPLSNYQNKANINATDKVVTIVPAIQKNRKCSFCGSKKPSETRITNCQMKRAYNDISTEYSIHRASNDYKNFCNSVLAYNYCYKAPNVVDVSLVTTISCSDIRGKHVFIYNCWKCDNVEQPRSLNHVNFCFSFINNSGLLDSMRHQCTGSAFDDMLIYCKGMKRHKYLYDLTHLNSDLVESKIVQHGLRSTEVMTTHLPGLSQMSTITEASTLDISSMNAFSSNEVMLCQPTKDGINK